MTGGAAVEVQAAQGVGLESRDPRRQRPAGGATGAHGRGAAYRVDDHGYAGGVGQRVDELALVALAQLAGLGVAAVARHLPRGRGDVGREPGARGGLVGHPVRERAAQLLDALAGAGRGRQHGHVGEPVGLEQAAHVGQHRLAPAGRHLVDVVEHDQHHVVVPGQGRQEATVDRRVGVLLRVEHPHHHVGHRDQPVDLEVVVDLGGVVVGQVEQHQPVEPLVLAAGVERRLARDAVARRDVEPAQQRIGAARSPQTQAVAHDVVGRRTPTAASVEPAERVERSRTCPTRSRRPARPRCARRTGATGHRRGPTTPAGPVDDVVVEAATTSVDGRRQARDALVQRRAATEQPAGAGDQPAHEAAPKRRSSTRRARVRSRSGVSGGSSCASSSAR